VNAGSAAHDPVRERIEFAALRLIGSRGLEATGIEALCERAGVSRRHFERRFADPEDCFLSLHDELAAELCERLRSAYEGPAAWHDRIWAAGWAAMRFLREDPLRARFLVVAVNGAGERAQARRDRLVRGLAELLDAGRSELGEPGSASRVSAEVIAGAIYGTVLDRVAAGCIERGEDFLPELVYMAVLPYLGSQAAEDELLVQPLR
jgi:AcrR family transcriptional regulator